MYHKRFGRWQHIIRSLYFSNYHWIRQINRFITSFKIIKTISQKINVFCISCNDNCIFAKFCCLYFINWKVSFEGLIPLCIQLIEKKRLWGRSRIFFLVPFLQVHKKWCHLLAMALQHPKPVPERLSSLKNWPLQHTKPVLAQLSRLKISCDNRY